MEENIEGLEKQIERLNLTGPLTEHLPRTRETGRGFPSSMDLGSGHLQEPEPQPEPQSEPVLRSAWNPEPRPPRKVVEKLFQEAQKSFNISEVKFESNTPAHKEFKKKLERYKKKRAKIKKKKRSSTSELTIKGLDQGLEQLMDENQGLGIGRDITAIEHLLNLKMSLGK
tara:strand:+ start:426 stop:935 length:510 start_codon:yes stop_codon:yes gene_type:complete